MTERLLIIEGKAAMLKRMISSAVVLAVCWTAMIPAGALWNPAEAGVEMTAEAIWLEDMDTGTVIWQKNADQLRSPASLTKMMTALLFAESNAMPEATFTIPEEMRPELDLIQEENGADIDLQIGETITLENLLYATLLPSANDAASALAWYLSGGDLDAFAEQMNARARELGCTKTSFNCAHGLHEEVGSGNWSTARDLALIAKAVAEDPMLSDIVSTTRHNLPMTEFHSAQRILWRDTRLAENEWLEMRNSNSMLHPENSCYRPYIRGIKTGYTTPAGRCLATTAVTDEGRYLLVYLGVEDGRDEEGIQVIYGEVAGLMDWVTESFYHADVAAGIQPVELPLEDSPGLETARLVPSGSVTALTDGSEEFIYRLPESVQAPLRDGEKAGSVQIFAGGEYIDTVDMVVEGEYPYSALLHYKNKLYRFLKSVFAG